MPRTRTANRDGEGIDLRRRNMADLAGAPPGTLVYTGDLRDAAALQCELEKRLRARGLELRAVGVSYLEIADPASPSSDVRPVACAFCRGTVWCGRCRRCGTVA